MKKHLCELHRSLILEDPFFPPMIFSFHQTKLVRCLPDQTEPASVQLGKAAMARYEHLPVTMEMVNQLQYLSTGHK